MSKLSRVRTEEWICSATLQRLQLGGAETGLCLCTAAQKSAKRTVAPATDCISRLLTLNERLRMLIRQSKFTSTNYVSGYKSNKAWYQLSHRLASAALPLHADVATVDQAEKPQMPIRHEWVIVSGWWRGGGGIWWHKGVCYNVLRHFMLLSFPDLACEKCF